MAADQLTLRCAPLTVTGNPEDGFQTTYGTVNDAGTLGTNSSGTSYGPLDCPDGTTATGFLMNTGEITDGVSLRCAAPAIRL